LLFGIFLNFIFKYPIHFFIISLIWYQGMNKRAFLWTKQFIPSLRQIPITKLKILTFGTPTLWLMLLNGFQLEDLFACQTFNI
jgi:hypothetical protein